MFRESILQSWRPIKAHGHTKVFLTYVGPLNTNFEDDKLETTIFREIRKIFAQNKKYVSIFLIL